MRNTTVKFLVGSGLGVDPFETSRRAVGGGRSHPRRDAEGHPQGTGKTGEPKDDGEGGEPKDGEKDKPKGKSEAEKAADKAAKTEKDRADALQKQLDDLIAEHATEDEKKTAATVKAKVAEAVAAKETELATKYEDVISGLRGEIIDGLIDTALAETGRSRDDFKTVIATLDKGTFLDENGAVKKADVSKWAAELAGSASKRPPRTGGSRATSTNRGMGQFLPAKD